MLADLDRAILDFEARWWKYPGRKEQAILDELGLTGVRYYQRLNALLDEPDALAYAPAVVNRLRRRRVTALRARNPEKARSCLARQ